MTSKHAERGKQTHTPNYRARRIGAVGITLFGLGLAAEAGANGLHFGHDGSSDSPSNTDFHSPTQRNGIAKDNHNNNPTMLVAHTVKAGEMPSVIAEHYAKNGKAYTAIEKRILDEEVTPNVLRQDAVVTFPERLVDKSLLEHPEKNGLHIVDSGAQH